MEPFKRLRGALGFQMEVRLSPPISTEPFHTTPSQIDAAWMQIATPAG